MPDRSLSRHPLGYLIGTLAFGFALQAAAGPIRTEVSTLAVGDAGSASNGPAIVDSEVFTERVDRNGGKWTGSALAQIDGDLELGTTGKQVFDGKVDVFADLLLDQTVEAGDPRISAVRFTVQPGEILFKSNLGFLFANEFLGSLSIDVSASINGVEVGRYDFVQRVTALENGIDINTGSTGTALVHLAHVSSGPIWGVRTEGFTDVLVLTPAIFPGDRLHISYDMHAAAIVTPVDSFFDFSVKLGDPLDGLGPASIELVTDPGVVFVPAPPTALLLSTGLVVMGAGLARASRRSRG